MSRSRTLSLPALAAAALALAAVAALVFAAPRAEALEKERCGATFRVLHNDRIGELRLPKGPYWITLINPDRITCAQASSKFAQFLQDFDGRLPNGWKLNVRKARFMKNGRGFQVKQAKRRHGHGGQHPGHLSTKCPTFRVLHNDLIDGVRFPAGTYQMTAFGTLSCPDASKLFARFLAKNQNNLPRGWRLNPRNGKFVHRSAEGFQVNLWRRG